MGGVTATIRTGAAALAAAMLLMLAFAGSYVGAFHKPTPHGVPLEVVAPPSLASRVTASLNSVPGHPVSARAASSRQAAVAAVLGRQVYAVYEAAANRLDVASAANRATAVALEELFARLAAAQHNPPPAVVDLAPLPASDPNGTSAFYAVVAWVFGGYLAATLLGLMGTPRSASRQRSLLRIGGLAAYSVIGALVTVLVLRGAFGVFAGHVLAMWAVATLIVFASGAATAGLQALAGVLGTGVVILLFVIVGNAASGGPYARPLLPGFWRTIGGILPPGAGVDLARSTLYFGGSRLAGPILALAAWGVLGIVAAVAVGGRIVTPVEAEAEAAAGLAGL
jgi:hypothetical protein